MDFEIPQSLTDVDESVASWPFRNAYCWECGSRENVDGIGRLALCGGCRASLKQQYLEEAARDREQDEED